MKYLIRFTCLSAISLLPSASLAAGELPNATWQFQSPREEIAPSHHRSTSGGYEDSAVLAIKADDREGLAGHWTSTHPVVGGTTYRFSVRRKATGTDLVRRTAPVRLLWTNDSGDRVLRDQPTYSSYLPGQRPRAEPEFPQDGETTEGWTEVTGTYQAPQDATQLTVELHFRWGTPQSEVLWSAFSLEQVTPVEPRIVRLAAIHHQPRGGTTAADKCVQFAPLIARAALEDADLVVLPETLTYYATGKPMVDCAESIPGESTEFFGKLAKKHDLYIVAGLVERDGHLVYNTSALIGPDGSLVGKYRKVTLPRSEIEAGLTPGDDYPVFDTRFGRVGMMICYDGFFPEVARQLSTNGAEVIAWPVWGCNPLLAQARACENHVFVVSSTYTDAERDWMETAVYGRDGNRLAKASQWSSVIVAEVDLAAPMHWHSLGDFQAQIERHRPRTIGE